ncbi:hypothetical protein BSLG_005675 [Batrachochytrium salamandrivorans]|nr:hypothetical protein BSLG_005675 [Batrachochytrium salamandrivorans]
MSSFGILELGKTTSAHLVARLEDFDVVEFNASDVRSKKALDRFGQGIDGNRVNCFFIWYSKLVTFKLSRADFHHQTNKIPIICICNDRSSPKIRSLANHCFDLRFRRPDARMISARVEMICKKEGLDISPNVIAELVDSTSADIRQILNILSTYKLTNNPLTYDEAKTLSANTRKNSTMSPFDIRQTLVPWNYLNQIPSLSTELEATGKQRFRNHRQLLSEAADSISMGDLVESVQRSFQHHSTKLNLVFTISWLGQNSKQAKAQRFLREIQIHMHLRTSADKNQVCQCYLPTLAQLLTRPSRRSSGKTAFTRIYNKMNHPKATMDTVPAKSVGKGHGSELKPDMEEIIDAEDQVLDDDASDAGGNDGDDAISNDRSIKIKNKHWQNSQK